MDMVSKSSDVMKKYGKMRELFEIPLFGTSMDRLLNLLDSEELKRPVWIATVNPEFIMATLKDSRFLELLKTRTSLNVIDGVGLAWAREVQLRITNDELLIIKKLKKIFWGLVEGVKVLGGGYKNKVVSGVDLMDRLCGLAEKKGRSVFFLGGWEDRGGRTAEYFFKKYPKLKVAGTYAGNKVGEDEKTLKILKRQPIDYLFVAYAMKSQEEWIERNLKKLDCGVVVGLGRTFDYYSGELLRAPKWMRQMGLEWFYSLLTDASRRKRKLELLKFAQKFYFGD